MVEFSCRSLSKMWLKRNYTIFCYNHGVQCQERSRFRLQDGIGERSKKAVWYGMLWTTRCRSSGRDWERYTWSSSNKKKNSSLGPLSPIFTFKINVFAFRLRKASLHGFWHTWNSKKKLKVHPSSIKRPFGKKKTAMTLLRLDRLRRARQTSVDQIRKP